MPDLTRRTILKGVGAALIALNLHLLSPPDMDPAKDVRVFIGDVEMKGYGNGEFLIPSPPPSRDDFENAFKAITENDRP